MKTYTLFVLVLTVVTISGCETFQEIDAAAGEWARKVKTERAARDEVQSNSRVLTAAKPRGGQRVVQSLTLLKMDPDTAYVRIKRHFGFMTFEEANKGMYPGWLETTNFRHETLPGVRYSLAQDINWSTRAFGVRNVWLNLDIERERSSTIVSWDYCVNTDGWESLGDPDAIKRNLAADIKRVVAGSRY